MVTLERVLPAVPARAPVEQWVRWRVFAGGGVEGIVDDHLDTLTAARLLLRHLRNSPKLGHVVLQRRHHFRTRSGIGDGVRAKP